MSENLAKRLRDLAREPLPEGAFLRRDRGDALFVTDAPRRAPDVDWPARFAALGFEARIEGGLLYVAPAARLLIELEKAHPEPPDFLCATLQRFAGREPDAAALGLFTRGLRALDGEPDVGYARALRQRAAECLRSGGGAGLYACGLIDHMIRKERVL